MDIFWKATGLSLIIIILVLGIGKSEFSVLLSIAGCCMVAASAVSFLKPVWELIWEIEAVGELQDGMLRILLKAAGISLVSELAGVICADAGNGALSKTLHLLSCAVILYLSIPVIRTLVTLIQDILGVL